MSQARKATPAVVLFYYPIYQPTLTKAVQSDFTLATALFEGLFQSPPLPYLCGAVLPEPDEFGT